MMNLLPGRKPHEVDAGRKAVRVEANLMRSRGVMARRNGCHVAPYEVEDIHLDIAWRGQIEDDGGRVVERVWIIGMKRDGMRRRQPRLGVRCCLTSDDEPVGIMDGGSHLQIAELARRQFDE